MMNETLNFAIQTAQQAGKLLMRYYRSSDLETKLKADHTAVTQADLASDQMISLALRESYPNEAIISEELQPELSSQMADQLAACWIVDPLDGTTNFSLGIPFWGVLLAHVIDGNPETAVIYFPALDELYYAQRGQGARLNHRLITPAAPNPQRPYTFFACCSRAYQYYQVNIPYKTRILGSSAYSFCLVARGSAVLAFEATPKIWDIAAPWLLVQESGGHIEVLEGRQPFPLDDTISYSQINFPSLAAAQVKTVHWAQRRIIPKQTT